MTSLDIKDISLPETAQVDSNTDSYKQIILALLASIINTNNHMFLPEYNTYINAAESILGKIAIENVETRIYVGALFLNFSKQTKDLVSKLKKAIVSQQIALNARKRDAEYFLSILEASPQNNEKGLDLAQEIISILLKKDIGEYVTRLDKIRIKTRKLVSNKELESQDFFSFLSFFGGNKKVVLETPADKINNECEEYAKKLMFIGKQINSQCLIDKTENFLQLVKPQPCSVAFVGEMKHGKSTLFNAIIEREFSPVGESVATTSAVIELFYSPEPCYEGKWFDSDNLQKIRDYIAENKNNPQIADYGECFENIISSDEFKQGGTIKDIVSLDQVANYATSKGDYSPGVERIKIGLAIPELKSGVVIVDVPGLNDPMHIRDYLTIQEAKKAHCVVFVMKADKLGTQSERSFLQSLLAIGCAMELIIVVTHIDRVSEEVKQNIENNVMNWLQGIIGQNNNLTKVQIFPIHASKAMDLRITGKYNKENDLTGFQKFWLALAQIAANQERNQQYIDWLNKNRKELEQIATTECEKFWGNYQKEFFSLSKVDDIKVLVEKFHSLAESYKDQITSRLQSIKERLQLEIARCYQDIQELQENLLIIIRAEIEGHVRKIGEEYAEQKHWQEFDQKYIPTIIERKCAKFQSKYEENIQLWYRERELFSREISENLSNCIDSLRTTRQEFIDICMIHSKIAALKCKADRIVTRIESAVKIGVSFFAGHTLTTGILGATLIVSNVFAVGGVAAVVGGWALWKSASDPEKRKENFIQARLEKAEKNLAGRFAEFTKLYEENLKTIGNQFVSIAESKYAPLIREALLSEQESKLQIDIIQRLTNDGKTYYNDLQKQITSHN